MQKFPLIIVLFFLGLFIQGRAQSLTVADSLLFAANYTAAIAAYDAYINSSQKKMPTDIGNAHLRKGVCLQKLEQSEKTLSCYFTALSIFEKANIAERTAVANKNIGLEYYSKSNFSRASSYYQKAFVIYAQLKDSVAIGKLLNDLALTSNELGRHDSALAYHLAALHQYRKHLSQENLFKHLCNLGTTYFSINKKDSAFLYYKEAEKNAAGTGDSSSLLFIYNNMGEYYREIKDYPNAVKYLTKGYNLTFTFGDTSNLAIVSHNLAEVYDSLKQFEKAHYFSQLEVQLNKAIYNSEKNKAALELSEKYESDKKDEKIKTQTRESTLKTRSLVIALTGLVLVAILGAISFSNYRKKQKANKILAEQNEKIAKLNTELDNSNQVKSKLFSVISHDLRSPISSLYAFLQMQQSHAAKGDDIMQAAVSKQIEQVLETLEDLLTWSKSQLHQFKPEKEKVYLKQLADQVTALSDAEIQQKQVTINNAIPTDAIINTDMNMLAIIFRNTIANAVKHANPLSEILLQTVAQNNNVQISIFNSTDNSNHPEIIGRLTNTSISSNYTGLGMVLIKEFTEKLNGSISYISHAAQIETRIVLPAT